MFHFQSARAGGVNDQSLFQTFCHRPTWPKTTQSLFQMVCCHQPTWPRTTQSVIQIACRGPAWPTATQPERVSNILSPTDLAKHDPELVSNFLSPTDLAHHYQERLSNCLPRCDGRCKAKYRRRCAKDTVQSEEPSALSPAHLWRKKAATTCAQGGRANLPRFLPRRQQRQGVMAAAKQSTGDDALTTKYKEIGRASCRERV